ncbi:hypothetical protein PhiCh1p87 [Natrialba phage PhiCh1]|uniref:Virus protein phiCh1-VP86 n=2 Tax=root TaxID=1 RepID=D3T2D8_NATMM|nr:hypothetical protein [Natrialba magadii]NP_666004.1 hypothetical protein PhiCh1p87 [Natrialba phage PhiCh1]YP_010078113.1 CxxC motif protein [Natrialba phage PhiCh1]AAM88760.1 unknown [Natrialba phage PhiCh1]ADD07747.1 virus protein phiCh1-VP86 [Natrialba magadii ATCC 43099]ELY22994.1 hypothetical protein C500_21060 [Natrialba magadii ATCC 43099]QBJ01264.1 CxxC motif protein [Natrialba phage PhiCh1]
MPEWEFCAKIHEDCGGVVRWVEAVDTPGVGYQGECLGCGETEIVVEAIIPIEDLGPSDVLELNPADLDDLRWDYDADFDENQERLLQEVPTDG